MKRFVIFLITAVLSVSSQTIPTELSALTIADAPKILIKFNEDFALWNNREELANWNYASNLTEDNLKIKLKVANDAAEFSKSIWNKLKEFSWMDVVDAGLKRQFQKFSIIGPSALAPEEYKEYNEIISNMENTYSTAKICDFKDKGKCNLALEPELTEIMAQSRDPEELKYIWTEWRKVSGEKVRQMYPRYVELRNLAAQQNGFENNAEYWLKEYEAENITDQIESLWQDVKPFYLQLHAYVRRQLNKKYGDKVVPKNGPIPAHLLGNMWGQTWSNIADFTYPYPGKQLPDATESMIKQNWDAIKIFKQAEKSFVSMNMSAMPESFWQKSILTKPEDREIVCHASAWDFYDGKDFRIKQCTRVNWDNLMTAYHEMGHVQYFIQYKDQPTIYREGANPAFHEAVGDVIGLSASSINYRKKLGLIDTDKVDAEADLNNLYFTALDKITFLPFAYTLDSWRWKVFQGAITPDQYNCQWWKTREDLQGIEAPVHRSEEDFDPASKYHIVSDTEYLRYFISFIIQFQFHKSLCIKDGQYDPANPAARPLHNCDILDSVKAGNSLKEMLQLGASKPWQDAMEVVTGQRQMDASGLLEYFKPLYDWLKIENERNGEFIGWESSGKSCVQTRAELAY